MRVGVYGRVSTSDKDQNPETQLQPLREFCQGQEFKVTREYVDYASATDKRGRVQWREMMDDAYRRKFDLLIVWKLDRAFRSVLDAAQTLELLRAWGVGLKSYQEPWLDTTSPFGEAMFHITVAFAQLERGTVRERVKAGMDRAKREGKKVGRPPVSIDPKRWEKVKAQLADGSLSLRKASKKLGVSVATIRRKLAEEAGATSENGCAKTGVEIG